MKRFDCAVLNPPFDGNLHLKINNNVLGLIASDGIMCAIHPGRWLLDPLASYKSTTDQQRFPDLVRHLLYAKMYAIDATNEFFDIENCTDMIVSVSSGSEADTGFDIFNTPLYKRCFDKILPYTQKQFANLSDHCERKCHDGWRVEVKDTQFPRYVQEKARKSFLVIGPEAFKDGYRITVPLLDESPSVGWWSETVGKSQFKREYPDEIPLSIRFNSKEEAINFRNVYHSKFMVNWCYMIKTDMHTPLAFMPWLFDYTRAWSDDDLCKLFGLDDEESEYMTRDVKNFIIKDFISYEKI